MAKAATVAMASAVDTYILIEYDLLVPAEDNVRGEITGFIDLADSIYQVGLQQPLRVHLLPDGRFEIIAGHRRHAALGVLIDSQRWQGPIPCMVSDVLLTNDDRVASMLVENLQRADLNPIEEAKAFERLTKEFRYKRADLALKIGRSESYVGDRLALTKLPDEIQASVSVGYYPLTAALMLKGVPHDVAVSVTKGGRVIATEDQIGRAVRAAEYDKLKATLTAAGTASGIEVVTEDRFGFRKDGEEIAAFRTLDDAKLLAKYEGAPKAAKLVFNDSPYSGSFEVLLVKPLTEKQLEARRAKQQEQWSAEQREKEAAKQARYEAERAQWTPGYQAWVDECDRLKAEHVAAEYEHEQAEQDAVIAWSLKVDAKTAAGWLFKDIIDRTPHWEMRETIKVLGYDGQFAGEAVDEWVTNYVNQGAKQLVQLAMLLLADSGNTDAEDHRDSFVTKLGIPDVPELVLPPEPTQIMEATDDPLDDVA